MPNGRPCTRQPIEPVSANASPGWTTAGGKYGNAIPGIDNAQTFWKSGVCALKRWGIDAFAFEAFDEPWKPVSKGENGESKDETHWGVYNADRTPKYDLSC